MILPGDFLIEVGATERGTFVRVLHLPTGKQRVADPVRRGDQVNRVREGLIAGIRSELYREDDVQVLIGRGDNGDFLKVTHLPTGKSRLEYPVGKRSARQLELTMLDEIVGELVREGENKSQRSGVLRPPG
jgi:hypothetical protein